MMTNRMVMDNRAMLKLLHDLKSPLSALRILRARDVKSPAEQNLLKATLQNLENLLAACVGESAGHTACTDRQIRSVCESLQAQHEVISAGRVKLHWSATGKFSVDINPTDLRRVLENLVNNALQASPCENSMVQIRVRQDLFCVTIEVVDCGFGIQEECLANMFNDEPNSSTEGWGIGLLIVRELIETAGGQLHFHSESGVGTRARLRFPSF